MTPHQEYRDPRTSASSPVAISLVDVMRLLQWRDLYPDPTVLVSAFENRVGALLRYRMYAASQESRRQLSSALPNASDDVLRRALLAPETSHRLRLNGDDDASITFAAQAIDTELRIMSTRANATPIGLNVPPVAQWTALGDFCLNDKRNVYVVPMIFSRIPIDMFSPCARSANSGDPALPDDDDNRTYVGSAVSAAVAAFRDAEAFLMKTAPIPAELIRKFVITIIAVPLPKPNAFSSASEDGYVGRVVIGNAERAGPHLLAEALVHEAIHNLLYIQEREAPWVSGGPKTLVGLTIQSPWSGRELPAHSWLHACFVWYGLVNFWRGVCAAHGSSVAEGRLAVAKGGFDGPKLDTYLPKKVSNSLTAESLKVICCMQEDVQALGFWP